jgi:predicted PurR-regulated permease PerM
MVRENSAFVHLHERVFSRVATLQFSRAAPSVIIVHTVALLHSVSSNLLVPRFIGVRVHIGPVPATVGILFWS